MLCSYLFLCFRSIKLSVYSPLLKKQFTISCCIHFDFSLPKFPSLFSLLYLLFTYHMVTVKNQKMQILRHEKHLKHQPVLTFWVIYILLLFEWYTYMCTRRTTSLYAYIQNLNSDLQTFMDSTLQIHFHVYYYTVIKQFQVPARSQHAGPSHMQFSTYCQSTVTPIFSYMVWV